MNSNCLGRPFQIYAARPFTKYHFEEQETNINAEVTNYNFKVYGEIKVMRVKTALHLEFRYFQGLAHKAYMCILINI